MPNVEHCLQICQTNLSTTYKATLKDYGRSTWTFPFQSHPSFKEPPPKVTEPRAKAKTYMLQVLRSGHHINGMLKYFSFLKTCDFVSACFVDKRKSGMEN